MEFRLQISCQTTNYLKLQNNCIYALPISRFQLSDILVLIADIPTLALRTGIDDITRFFGPSKFQVRWRYLQFSGGGLVLSQILLIVIILFIPIYREPFFIFYLFYTIGINEEF